MKDFMTAEIDWTIFGRQEVQNRVIVTVVEDALLDIAKNVKYEKQINSEQPKWWEYKNFNHPLFRILLGQCDKANKCEVKQHSDFK